MMGRNCIELNTPENRLYRSFGKSEVIVTDYLKFLEEYENGRLDVRIMRGEFTRLMERLKGLEVWVDSDFREVLRRIELRDAFSNLEES